MRHNQITISQKINGSCIKFSFNTSSFNYEKRLNSLLLSSGIAEERNLKVKTLIVGAGSMNLQVIITGNIGNAIDSVNELVKRAVFHGDEFIERISLNHFTYDVENNNSYSIN